MLVHNWVMNLMFLILKYPSITYVLKGSKQMILTLLIFGIVTQAI